MSQYADDYPPRRPRGRDDGGYPAPPSFPPQDGLPPGPADHLPPPPMGDNRRSAMKRDGSRSRVPQHMRPDFPDEASYLGSQAPDLERKNRRRDKEFRDKRDGYESEEGDMLRKEKQQRPNREEEVDSRRQRFRDDRDANQNGASSKRPKDRGDGRGPPSRSGYDDRDDPPPRRRRDRDGDYDDDPPPRRRGGGGGGAVEYGSEPIPAVRRRNTDAGRSRQDKDKPRRRRDDYDDDSDSDSPPRRRRSAEGRDRRRRDKYDDEDRNRDPDSRDQRRRREEIYDRDRDGRRRDQSRRRGKYSDDSEDDYDRRSDRRGGDRDRNRGKKPPRKMEVGGYDIGPLIDKGQKHYGTVAPIVAPLLMNAARKYLSNSNGKK
ncbi:hypothetical protein LTR53_002653 [Teratosphaeriaceae sp. CCFEE 6253]|nr:hypothetical protein LTR53_002653 [Teratosphaeriaceae sp. CCFEE 6253]